MTQYKLLIVLLFAVCLACNQSKSPTTTAKLLTEIKTKGTVVSQDSIKAPLVTSLDKSKLTKIVAKDPITFPAFTNPPKDLITQTVTAGAPIKCEPGKNSFSKPMTVAALDSSIIPSNFDVVIVKDPVSKDRNSQNFSTYKKMQGLINGNISCLLEDRVGNIWFGTGGGVTKYDGKYFTHITTKQGLSNNDVRSILEDKSGNIWFGTEDGITKYDGKQFHFFRNTDFFLNKAIISSLLEDKLGNIWIGTTGFGLIKYDGKSFTNFTPKEGLYSDRIFAIKEDKHGNLWIGGNKGLTKYDGRSFLNYTTKEGLTKDFIADLEIDNFGNLWIGTIIYGISKFDGKTFTHYQDKDGLGINYISSIFKDSDGNIWFGTFGGGVCKYDGTNFIPYTEQEGLPDNAITCSLEDKHGNMWFGTNVGGTTFGGGLVSYQGKILNFYSNYDGSNQDLVDGVKSNDINCVFKDRSNKIWFGSITGVSYLYDKTFYNYKKKDGFPSQFIYAITQDKLGNIWFGGNGGIIKFDGKTFTYITNENGLPNNFVYSVVSDKLGNIWIGTNGGGLIKFDGEKFTQYTDESGLINNTVYKVIIDSDNTIWASCYGGGLVKFDGKTFTHFTKANGLPNESIQSLFEDRDENLWIGMVDGGLSRYDGNSFLNFSVKDGLSNNDVWNIIQDQSGNLVIGTRYGINSINNEVLKKFNDKNVLKPSTIFTNYTYDDGFLGVGCSGNNSMCEDDSGTIWIGTNDRLTAYHPKNIKKQFKKPNIQITSLELFKEGIDWQNLKTNKDSVITLKNGISISDMRFDSLSRFYEIPQNLSLANNTNNITFNFLGITTKQPKKIKYQYFLQGSDLAWSITDDKNEASYGNLSPGNYVFKVKAINSDGVWSDEINYAFTIRPPFWQTWWFKLLAGSIIISAIVIYIKWRERTLKLRQQILEKQIKIATADIKEQKHLIEEKHKEITDSINYAERIQRSFLATKDLLDENLKDYFVFFKPKDVVSGDFYWASKITSASGVENFVLATADSTGHGVPGAIMSLLNITSLESAIKEGCVQSADILNHTRQTIIERLKKDGSIEGGKDGMDVSLICFNFSSNSFNYSTANNPIWIVRNNELIELKGDKMPVGKHDKDSVPFTQNTFELLKGDLIYTLTDGFPDQFGGNKGKKFMYKQLKDTLVSISDKPMSEQNQMLSSILKEWMGETEQVDDITIIGIRI